MDKQEYERVLELLRQADPLSKEYDQLLGKLNEIVHIKKGETEAFPPPPATGIAAILGNQALVLTVRDLAVTGAVLYHERTNVITSRIFSFVRPNKS